MMTTTLARPIRAHSRSASRAVQSLDDRFLELTGGYRLFGMLIQSRQIPKMQHLSDIGCWIAARSIDGASSELLDFLHDACRLANPAWYDTLTAVSLPQDSRGIEAGVHYFSAVSDFSQIPDGSAPRIVHEACTQAMLEHPGREFLYLEPFMVSRRGVREFVTRESCGQLLQFQQRTIARVASRARVMLRANRFVLSTIEQIARFLAPRKARDFYGLTKDELTNLMIKEHEEDIIEKAMNREMAHLRRERGPRTIIWRGKLSYEQAVASLATSLDLLKMRDLLQRYDPIIAFEVPEFAREFNGHMPFALVAHWD